eukprot:g8113.t1
MEGVTQFTIYCTAITTYLIYKKMSIDHTNNFLLNCIFYDPNNLSIQCIQSGLEQIKQNADKNGLKVKELNVETITSLKQNKTTFNIALFNSLLKTNTFGRLLLYSPLIPSSQTLLKTYFDGIQNGLICIVDRQSQGKGRGGNVWESPHGCSMFSFKSVETNGARLPFIQYMISLAIIKAIKALPGGTDIDIGIKWPNDIYVNKTIKIGGVLCQSSSYNGVFDVTLGVGINTTNDQPTVSLNSILRSNNKTIPELKREQVISEILNQYENMMDIFNVQGFKPFEDEYCKAWLHSNQRVQVVLRDGKDPIDVTIKGISNVSGGLYSVDDDGNKYELYPDGNSFDFFKGLIRRKL